jgi:uncharacterized protein YaaR (DUF327 family)
MKTQKHQNRTITLCFGATLDQYNQLIKEKDRFIQQVVSADTSEPFKEHKQGCNLRHRFARHNHYERTLIGIKKVSYSIIVWQVRCLDCGALFTIHPSFVIRYKRYDTEFVQKILSAILIFEHKLSWRRTYI